MGRPFVRVHGFTLLELMIVLSLAAVILALGAPNFAEFRRNARLTGAANDWLAATQLARTEAIKRQARVSICPTAEPQSDLPACSGDAEDFAAWLVFEDVDNDCAPATTNDIVQRGTIIAGAGSTVDAAADGICVAFGADGFPRPVPGVEMARRFVFCDERGYSLQAGTGQSAARGIEISSTGRGAAIRDPARLETWNLACGT